MNLHEKLIAVRKEVKVLTKDQHNAGQGFNFVSNSQTVSSLREKMDELGLLLMPQVHGHTVERHDTRNGGKQYFTELEMSFTWVNAEEPKDREELTFYAQGTDSSEKGVGKALTYAEKYFLLKFFNIPTDSSDPDTNNGSATASPAGPPTS